MGSYAKMVIWMGLILMALQIAAEWATIRSTLFKAPSSSGSGLNLPGFPLPVPILLRAGGTPSGNAAQTA